MENATVRGEVERESSAARGGAAQAVRGGNGRDDDHADDVKRERPEPPEPKGAGTKCTMCLAPVDLETFLKNDHVCNDCLADEAEFPLASTPGKPQMAP